MKSVIGSEKKPIKMWLDDLEEGALEQAKNLANLPFTFKHVSIMPDSHQGYGMPIGGVLATKGVVISQGTIINWRRKGILPYFQVPDSSRILYSVTDIERIESQYTKEALIEKPISNRKWRI